jgi:hypothetical protein
LGKKISYLKGSFLFPGREEVRVKKKEKVFKATSKRKKLKIYSTVLYFVF